MKTATLENPTKEAPAVVSAYPVMEHFYTLQGEGAWVGVAAYFIRLAGCDVGCFWCDVKESWNAALHPILETETLVQAALTSGTGRVVITGGEPLLHDLTGLAKALHTAGFIVHIETSGTQPLSGSIDWICFSPKKFKAPLDEFYEAAHELKVIVHNKHDLAWAEGHAARCNPATQLFLQPEWYTPESAGWIIAYVKANPKWRLSLQTHKYLDIP